MLVSSAAAKFAPPSEPGPLSAQVHTEQQRQQEISQPAAATGLGGAVIEKVSPEEVPPPGPGVTTVIVAACATIKSAAGITALREVADP
jgi:hypothetical protein